ncbi:hypothetical protein X975_06722, partial [Stegodyphus mimosarum]
MKSGKTSFTDLNMLKPFRTVLFSADCNSLPVQVTLEF